MHTYGISPYGFHAPLPLWAGSAVLLDQLSAILHRPTPMRSGSIHQPGGTQRGSVFYDVSLLDQAATLYMGWAERRWEWGGCFRPAALGGSGRLEPMKGSGRYRTTDPQQVQRNRASCPSSSSPPLAGHTTSRVLLLQVSGGQEQYISGCTHARSPPWECPRAWCPREWSACASTVVWGGSGSTTWICCTMALIMIPLESSISPPSLNHDDYKGSCQASLWSKACNPLEHLGFLQINDQKCCPYDGAVV